MATTWSWVPNNKLGQAIYTNYFLPEPRMGMSVSFGVAYDSDIDKVEAVLLDESKTAVGTIPGLLGDPPPKILFNPGPGDWAPVFQVNFNVGQYSDQFLVQSELRKLLYKRLRKEGIELNFPTRTVQRSKKAPHDGVDDRAGGCPAWPGAGPRLRFRAPCPLAGGAWMAGNGSRSRAANPARRYVLTADLEAHAYRIEPAAWDLIVCWLYWQPDLLPEIASGVRPGGIVALAGKTAGRFATSLEKLSERVPGLEGNRRRGGRFQAYFIARRS